MRLKVLDAVLGPNHYGNLFPEFQDIRVKLFTERIEVDASEISHRMNFRGVLWMSGRRPALGNSCLAFILQNRVIRIIAEDDYGIGVTLRVMGEASSVVIANLRQTKSHLCLILTIIGMFWVGCTTTKTVWKCEPEVRKASNPFFHIELSAYCDKFGCMGFHLFLENKTDRDFEIDWSKTFYLSQGKENGGFFFEGIILRGKKERKPTEILVAYGVLSTKIIPESLMSGSDGLRGGDMGPGEHGIQLTVKVEGREVSEKLVINLLKMEIQEKPSL